MPLTEIRKKVIGIAGTAKNTGKTTTLNCLLKEAFHRNIPVGVTGIGFDGEELDNVTLLPKPRVTVYPNFIVTTSERCLDISTAHVEILHRTGMYTSLGEILMMRVIQTGLIVIAGPNKKMDLNIVIEKMTQHEIDYIFIDGSLNRIAPLSVVDSIIFTTGASRSTDLSILSSEMHALENLFKLPITLNDEHTISESIVAPLLIEEIDVEALSSKLTRGNKTLYISNLISIVALERLTTYCVSNSSPLHHVIFPNPFALLLNGNIIQTYKYIAELNKSNIAISYRCNPKLSCITANPFFPQYFGHKYFSHYIDKIELIKQLRFSCSTPIFDTRETNSSIIFDKCIR